jgi:hypothetical protein
MHRAETCRAKQERLNKPTFEPRARNPDKVGRGVRNVYAHTQPSDEQARRLAVWMRIRRIHHDRLCLDFEHEARWWAYSASPALRDTFRRDAFPVGKPANTPRELLDSLEEL